ncbi:MAG: aldolase [Methanomicrobiales archaeon]|nr:aldolase [Methanomicrobiales archaeon]
MRDKESNSGAVTFSSIGQRLMNEHLVGGNFGNMSIRTEDGFCITPTGSFLNDLLSVVYVPLHGDVPKQASSEYRVHREIYTKTDAQAIVHAHPPYAVSASLIANSDILTPIDSEGKMFAPIIPIVIGEPGTQELATMVSDALMHAPICIAMGHGTFSIGETLEKAYLVSSLVEHSCTVLILTGTIQPPKT